MRATLGGTSSLQAPLAMEKVNSSLGWQTVHTARRHKAKSLDLPEQFDRWGLGLPARSGSGILAIPI